MLGFERLRPRATSASPAERAPTSASSPPPDCRSRPGSSSAPRPTPPSATRAGCGRGSPARSPASTSRTPAALEARRPRRLARWSRPSRSPTGSQAAIRDAYLPPRRRRPEPGRRGSLLGDRRGHRVGLLRRDERDLAQRARRPSSVLDARPPLLVLPVRRPHHLLPGQARLRPGRDGHRRRRPAPDRVDPRRGHVHDRPRQRSPRPARDRGRVRPRRVGRLRARSPPTATSSPRTASTIEKREIRRKELAIVLGRRRGHDRPGG